MSKFSTSGKGFHLTFENGLTISVQWGWCNYCSNKTLSKGLKDELTTLIQNRTFDAISAEIAVWDAEGTWMNFEHDQVKGWVSADEVADYITKVKNATSIAELHEGKGIIWATDEED
jgi:hypothetical protein